MLVSMSKQRFYNLLTSIQRAILEQLCPNKNITLKMGFVRNQLSHQNHSKLYLLSLFSFAVTASIRAGIVSEQSYH